MKTQTSNKSRILNKDQQLIFDVLTKKLENTIEINMLWENMYSLVGSAGTGKTFLTVRIIEYFLSQEYDVIVTAPTHKAVNVLRKNLPKSIIRSTKTIHSFLNIKLVTDFNNGTQVFKIDKEAKDTSKTDLLIVDESSMVSKELYEYIEDTIRKGRVKAVLFIGDIYQLLPIDSNNQILNTIANKFRLDLIVRQAKDSYIIKTATKLRESIANKTYSKINDFFNINYDKRISFFHNKTDFYEDFCSNDKWYLEDKVIATFTNANVDKHNHTIRQRFWKTQGNIDDIPVLLAGDTLVFQERFNDIFNNGDSVVIDYAKKEFFEALDISYWECKTEDKKFKVIDPDDLHKYKKALSIIASRAKKEKSKGKRYDIWQTFFSLKDKFADVKFKFSSTIHKLQGSTYDTVYIDILNTSRQESLDMDNLYRLIYVAITRASRDIKILIPKFTNDKESMEILGDDIKNILSFGTRIG